VKYRALSNDRIGQLNRSTIQEHHVDPIRLEGTSQFVGEMSLNTLPLSGPIDQYAKVIVAHWTKPAVDLGSKKIDQANTLDVSQYG
jgi:hypothetical protein